MKKILITLMLAAFVSALVLSGCSKQSLETSPVETGLNFADDFGGYDISDEAPAFGDPTIAETMAADAEMEFPEPELTPIFDSLDRRTDIRVWRMEILWGMLEYDSTVADVTDWSGSLEIKRGAIRVGTIIRFERGDHVIRRERQCSTVNWVSYTKPHYDGIMVFIYEVVDSTSTEPNTVIFKTGPYERTFEMSELDSLSEIVQVDELGNKVSFNSMLTTPEDRDRGFLRGRWVKAADSGRGVFFGRWMSWDGIFKGHVRGHWGVNDEGGRVFFGKWISMHGTFKGLLRGEWDYDNTTVDAVEPATGSFRGVWADRTLTVKGKLGGTWAADPRRSCDGEGGTDDSNGDTNRRGREDIGEIPRSAHGFFHGRWAANDNQE